jgi:nucleotide-binding universal stress UspA family protein
MKKILVPIDYSAHSDNAIKFAIEIAKKIKADVHICHGLEAPELIAMPGYMVWPAEDFSELKEDADQDMEKYVAKLKEDIQLSAPYLPNITFSTGIGITKHFIDQEISSQVPDLVVMGMEGKGNMDRFFFGSVSKEMIENPTVPILLVPKNAVYEPIKKIAFATDLSESDLNSIHDLARMFCLYDPEILLVHVDDEPSDFHDPRTPANQFLNRVTCNINYGKIYYRHIQEPMIDQGLKWLSENGQMNIISMIHRHTGVFSRLLTGSHTQKLAKSVHVPLLVMPEDKEPIGW